jgi:anti-sigma B factor antagonist
MSTRSGGLHPLRCTVSRPRPHTCVVHLAGDLDMDTVPGLAEYLREQTAGRPAYLVLDLSDVTLLAAAGVALIVEALDDGSDIHGRLHLTGVTGNRPVARVFEITGLLQVLDVHDDLEALLDALHRN